MNFFAEDKNKKCEEFIKIITNRLKELEAETNELKEYQRLDKDKRALEYSLAEHELNVGRISNEEYRSLFTKLRLYSREVWWIKIAFHVKEFGKRYLSVLIKQTITSKKSK